MQGVIVFKTAWLISLGSLGMVSAVKPNLGKVGEKAVKKAAKQLSQISALGGLLKPAARSNGRKTEKRVNQGNVLVFRAVSKRIQK